MSLSPSTLLPFLYPRRLLVLAGGRIAGGYGGHRHGFRQPLRRPRCKSTLTAAAARTLLDAEIPTLPESDKNTHTSTATATTATTAASDHRTPPFLDTLTLTLHSGHGGHGCVSFLREKFVSHGPPNGGDGGDGGDVYITVDPQLSSLHKLSRMRIVKAGKGSNGLGGGMNGARGEDVVVKVPPGTVVRVLDRGDVEKGSSGVDVEVAYSDNYQFDSQEDGHREYDDGGGYGYVEKEETEFITKHAHDGRTDADPAAILEEKLKRRRRRNRTPRRFERSNVDDPASEFIHYPLSLARNLDSPHWPPRRPPHRDILQPDVFKLDFSDDALFTTGIDIAGRKTTTPLEPTLLLKGGAGGYGNPNFITKDLRRPMWATKGAPGTSMKIQLELKLLADVGLVGRPNVGKSSLLRCVTRSRARVGNWAFTTLTPNMGTVILDGGLGTGDIDPDTNTAAGRERFTIADIPGLVKDAGENKGLGWDFLRHVERARGLVFVIDLSFDPVRQIEGLWADIAAYEAMRDRQRLAAVEEEKALREAERIRREDAEDVGVIIRLSEEPDVDAVTPAPGITEKPWMVVGNKADVEGARDRFSRLQEYLNDWKEDRAVKQPMGCIAVSALPAGAWTAEDHERQVEVWRGVISWFRSLVN
ncbi:GTPase of the mitochondrial inner membrane that associates with the large ribosomal subunit [Orbilia brochopaga]|uniref:GTPase of the mitochondrial inner membrane that associates with the large ribosomal subunit n=1 Tax=Orbilia brochopaga TaxID=3140254 RepID=A0AAV9V6W1_9PEZI